MPRNSISAFDRGTNDIVVGDLRLVVGEARVGEHRRPGPGAAVAGDLNRALGAVVDDDNLLVWADAVGADDDAGAELVRRNGGLAALEGNHRGIRLNAHVTVRYF